MFYSTVHAIDTIIVFFFVFFVSGGWRPVIFCSQRRVMSTSRGCTVLTVWCVRVKGWGPFLTCLTTAPHCCPGLVLNYCGRSDSLPLPLIFPFLTDVVNNSFGIGFVTTGPARLWCKVRHLQFGYCSLWACQRQGAFSRHAGDPGNAQKKNKYHLFLRWMFG